MVLLKNAFLSYSAGNTNLLGYKEGSPNGKLHVRGGREGVVCNVWYSDISRLSKLKKEKLEKIAKNNEKSDQVHRCFVELSIIIKTEMLLKTYIRFAETQRTYF